MVIKTGLEIMIQTFKSSVWPPFIITSATYWILALSYRGYFLMIEERWIPIHKALIVNGTIGLFAIMLAITWFYKLKIVNGEIKGTNKWGVRTTIPYSDNLQFRESKILGYKHLKIWNINSDVIWVCLPVSNQIELYDILSLKNYNKSNTHGTN